MDAKKDRETAAGPTEGLNSKGRFRSRASGLSGLSALSMAG